MDRCVTHRSYEAKSAPRKLCIACWEIFLDRNPDYRRIIEAAQASVMAR